MPNESPYVKQASPAIDERARSTLKVALVPDEEHAVIARMRGACPVCTHEVRFEYPLVAVQGVDEARGDEESLAAVAESLGRSSGSEDIRGHCLCNHVHQGQPSDEPGCGARWGMHISWGSA
jgi:hypothetical protein